MLGLRRDFVATSRRAGVIALFGWFLLGGVGLAQEPASTAYTLSFYGKAANKADLDRWAWSFGSPFAGPATAAVWGTVVVPDRYSGRGPAEFTLVATRGEERIELAREECMISGEALCEASAWPVNLEAGDRVSVAFAFSGLPKMKWDESVWATLQIVPAAPPAAASVGAGLRESLVGPSELEREAGSPSANFVARLLGTSRSAYVPADASEGTRFARPKKFDLADIVLAQDLGPGLVCVEGIPRVCRGEECGQRRRGKAVAKIEVQHADGTVEKRRLVQNRKRYSFPICGGLERDLLDGARVRASVRVKQYPRTLVTNAEGLESDSTWVRVSVKEKLITEPGKVKINGARLHSTFTFVANANFVYIDGMCNGLDRYVDAVAIPFRRGPDGEIRRFSSPYKNKAAPCTSTGPACARLSPNQCKNASTEMTSLEKGKADGFILQIVDRTSGSAVVVRKWVFEGPEYAHEWFLP